jgi:tRNA1(Val) A37 N6-methylase TrmN6
MFQDKSAKLQQWIAREAQRASPTEPEPKIDMFPYVSRVVTLEDMQGQFERLRKAQANPVLAVSERAKIPNLEFTAEGISKLGLNFTYFPYSEDSRAPSHAPYALIKFNPGVFLKENILSTFFMENVRVRAKRHDCKLSPWQIWHIPKFRTAILQCAEEFKDEIIPFTCLEFKKTSPKHLDLTHQSHLIHKMTKGCAAFDVVVARSLYAHFKAEHVLDFCAGWADRLVSALTSPNVKSYTGVDCNLDLKTGYQALLDGYKGLHSVQVDMYYEDWLECKLERKPKDLLYDFIFTCPPYFDLEEYNPKDKKQSMNQFVNIEAWITKFLFVALDKGWPLLKPGGTMCIAINDYTHGRYKYCERMVHHMVTTHRNATFCGMIAYAPERHNSVSFAQPIWVFQKESMK